MLSILPRSKDERKVQAEIRKSPKMNRIRLSPDSSMLQVLDAVTALDICCARGRHAQWCGAVRPRFLRPEEAAQQGSVQVGQF